MATSPERFFQAIEGYQSTAAVRGAIELDLFTRIDEGAATVPALARRLEASPRGVRILCDYLVVKGFLEKHGERYGLTPDTAAFLSRRSASFLGGTIEFLLAPEITGALDDVAGLVRRGTTLQGSGGSLDPGFPGWPRFARAMAPLATGPAGEIADLVAAEGLSPRRVLDVAAGHGLYGIALATRHPRARVTAIDWPAVLEVARENARRARVEDRYETLAGSALRCAWPPGCDVVLLTNFLHHFDPTTCARVLRKAREALAPGGRVVTLEFVPDEGRVSPPRAAAFALRMLASTPAGDAYTLSEYERLFREAGFRHNRLVALRQDDQSVLLSAAAD